MIRRWLIRCLCLLPLAVCVAGWGWSYSRWAYGGYEGGVQENWRLGWVGIDRGWIFAGIQHGDIQWGHVPMNSRSEWFLLAAETTHDNTNLLFGGDGTVSECLGFFWTRFTYRANYSYALRIPFYFPTLLFCSLLLLVWRKTGQKKPGGAFPVVMPGERNP